MNKKLICLDEINKMNKGFRTNFINSLSGFKSLNLAGTISTSRKITNLAPISSVIHVGANPPLIGMLLRPDSVPRHTLENIRENGFWTLNHVNKDLFKKAHQCSARYDDNISEFHAVNLKEEFHNFPAPFVEEAKIKIGLELTEEHTLKSNGTHLLVGKVHKVYLPENTIEDDGFISLEKAGSLTVSGLDSYHFTTQLQRLPYAKP